MTHIKKMLLIDPRMLETLKGSNQQPTPNIPVPDATGQSLVGLDKEMREILQEETDTDVYTQLTAYKQLLRRFLNQAKQMRNKPLGKVEITKPATHAVSKPKAKTENQKTEPKTPKQQIKDEPGRLFNTTGSDSEETGSETASEHIEWETFGDALNTPAHPRPRPPPPTRAPTPRASGTIPKSKTPGRRDRYRPRPRRRRHPKRLPPDFVSGSFLDYADDVAANADAAAEGWLSF